MKNIFIIILSFLLNWTAMAQKVQFTNSSNKWSFRDSTTGCCIPILTDYSTAYYDSTASVVYNGHSYQSLVTTVASFLVREDAGRVYVIGTPDSTERILYDFNLGANDTLRFNYASDTLVTWVSQFDSTEFGGLWYKVWHFNGLDYSTIYADSVRPIAYNVIEGIGCTNGLYFPASPYNLLLFSEQLLCFTNDAHISSSLSNPVIAYGDTFTSNYDNNASCTEFYTHHTPPTVDKVAGIAASDNKVSVVPNPVNETSRIVLSRYIAAGKLAVINNLGQIIYNAPIRNCDEIKIGDKINAPGTYYYRLTDDMNKNTWSGKIVYTQ